MALNDRNLSKDRTPQTSTVSCQLVPSSSREEGDHTPRLSLWDLQCMWAIQGGMKLTLNSPTMEGNHCTSSDHNFEYMYGNYAVPSHETRDMNNDGGVPTLLTCLSNAAADFQQALGNANEDRRSTVQHGPASPMHNRCRPNGYRTYTRCSHYRRSQVNGSV